MSNHVRKSTCGSVLTLCVATILSLLISAVPASAATSDAPMQPTWKVLRNFRPYGHGAHNVAKIEFTNPNNLPIKLRLYTQNAEHRLGKLTLQPGASGTVKFGRPAFPHNDEGISYYPVLLSSPPMPYVGDVVHAVRY